ncbi:WD40-repeat-containing domain protein [Suillus variegatus]|nr:WD40-repeat-containing domain protein [Suillus variegatus]
MLPSDDAHQSQDARRIPRGFFDDSRDARIQGRRDRQPLSTPKFLLGRLTSLWRRPDSHGPTERNTISRPHPLNWAQHFVSDMLHRRSETDIELREIPVVDVPYTSGKPRNYHARKKPSASSSRPPNSHTTQQPSAATQNTPSSSQGPPAISTTSEALPAVATTTLATETTSRHNITVIQAGCWIRFLLWIGYGKSVASGSGDGAVRLWDMDTGKVVKKFTGHTEPVASVCWSPDGERVVSGSDDETFRVWDVESSETILILAPKMNKKEDDFIRAVCDYSPDGDMIATGGDNYGLKIWNANTGETAQNTRRSRRSMVPDMDLRCNFRWRILHESDQEI